MTPRRRKFEAYHKTAGYFAGFFAVGAVASVLMQYPMPVLKGVMLITALLALVVCIVMEHKGCDTMATARPLATTLITLTIKRAKICNECRLAQKPARRNMVNAFSSGVSEMP